MHVYKMNFYLYFLSLFFFKRLFFIGGTSGDIIFAKNP
jgi:hypothetical protein